MKHILSYLFLLSVMQSCSNSQNVLKEAKSFQEFRGFEPTDPTEHDETVPIVVDGQIEFKKIRLLSPDQMLGFLNNETVLVSIGKITAEGAITYLPVSISAKGSNYKVIMDYMKSATLPVMDSSNENIIGLRRVGVGLRLISQITTFEAGVNIGDLSSIGIAVKSGKASGTLMVEVIGIKSKDVTTLIPLPSEINQTTIQNAMQALATIKSKIYDKETILYPQVMALNSYFKGKLNKPTLTDEDKKEDLKSLNKIQLQFGKNKYSSATNLERQAFNYLFDKRVDLAIQSFDACAGEYPNYHSVAEISAILKKNRSNLADNKNAGWKEIYNIILTKYSWKLGPDVIQKLTEETK